MTPTSSTKISTPTNIAAGISVTQARIVSSRANRMGARVESSAAAIACSDAGTISMSLPATALAQTPDLLLQHRPGLGAVFFLPLGIEAGRTQRRAEFVGFGGVECHSLLSQLSLQRLVEISYVLALLESCGVDVARYDLLQILRQIGPGLGVGERPEAVPHVIGEGDVFLYFVKLEQVDQGQGVLLALDNLGLQGRIHLVDV